MPAKVDKSKIRKGVTEEEHSLKVVESEGKVYVEKGVTKNMGDYNSARVTIGVTLPINPTPEQIKDAKKAIKIASDIIDVELEKQVDEILD